LSARAFASERCPDCCFWLVGVEDQGVWFCTVCGVQVADLHLLQELRNKAAFKAEITEQKKISSVKLSSIDEFMNGIDVFKKIIDEKTYVIDGYGIVIYC
jgi:uncharacterized Zn finger protein (UPF0148 family)